MLQLIHVTDLCVLHCFCGLNYLPAWFFFKNFSRQILARMVLCGLCANIHYLYTRGKKSWEIFIFQAVVLCIKKKSVPQMQWKPAMWFVCSHKEAERRKTVFGTDESHVGSISVLFPVKLTRTVVVYYQSSSLRILTNFGYHHIQPELVRKTNTLLALLFIF